MLNLTLQVSVLNKQPQCYFMRIDRTYLPVETLGPGRRIVLWAQGCSKHCPGCSNPELWQPQGGRDIPEDALASMLIQMATRAGIDRITFTGGDPLEQPRALLDLLRKIRAHFCDILIYTGYTLAEVQVVLGETLYEEFTCLADALIDGRYVEAQNDGKCALRGSTNQQLHLFTASEDLRAEYGRALSEPRCIQNVVFDGRSFSIGIHAT